MNKYLQKYGFQAPQITEAPQDDLELIVVIPVYDESELIQTLESLANCQEPLGKVEVICVINSSENEGEEVLERNRQTQEELRKWISRQQSEFIRFYSVHEAHLPKKHAGVGLARKIGMDEAVARFDQIQGDGIIICFDADSTCDDNYLLEIEKHFKLHPKTPGCSIHFEHPTLGTQFDLQVYLGIINYELHLRYYKEAMTYCQLPYAFHTVGSSMAVRSSAYQKQGGMNKRKAGEDFYFLHKIIALGGFTNLTSTRVIPSPRSSERVPFGTGRAIGQWLNQTIQELPTYSFQSFICIRSFVLQLPAIYEERMDSLPRELHTFLADQGFSEAVQNAKDNSSSYDSFSKRFFAWFDAFRLLKCVHYLRDHHFADQLISGECSKLLRALEIDEPKDLPVSGYLKLFRHLEKK